MRFFRREPHHRRLAREAGVDPPRPLDARPLDTRPQWGEVGIHGVARPREWDAVVAVEADLAGEAAAFVALPDGTLVVEDGPDDVAPLADAVERSLEPPYRAEAVRRGPTAWAVAARRIAVVRVPEAPGDEIRLAVTREGRQVVVDGMPTFGGVPALEALLEGDGVVVASRLDGDLFEARVDRL